MAAIARRARLVGQTQRYIGQATDRTHNRGRLESLVLGQPGKLRLEFLPRLESNNVAAGLWDGSGDKKESTDGREDFCSWHAPRRWPSRNPPVRRPPVCAYQELGSAKLPQTESAPNITQLTCLLSSSLESSFRPAIPLFGVPVRWSASDNEIILSDALLELPVHTDNTGLYPHLLHNVDTHRT